MPLVQSSLDPVREARCRPYRTYTIRGGIGRADRHMAGLFACTYAYVYAHRISLARGNVPDFRGGPREIRRRNHNPVHHLPFPRLSSGARQNAPRSLHVFQTMKSVVRTLWEGLSGSQRSTREPRYYRGVQGFGN